MNISLYDRRVMILILKRNGRRSFTEGSNRKIKDLHKSSYSDRHGPLISFTATQIQSNTNTQEQAQTESENTSEAPSSPDSTSSFEIFGTRD